ncbi:MAG TPA: type I methionyl aminopeptidase [Candidatus Saccharimonadales bacterium]|nr:type I methionyl aminopeptidase [Candidatus Saccharimonadales bacterium]
MIDYKTTEEITIMKTGGKILSDVLFAVLKHAKEGITELELDGLAEKLIIEAGGEPGFKKVKGYKHTICVSTNEVVVHGIPSSYKLKAGDVVGIDCGVFYKGFHTDMSETIKIQNSKFKIQNEKNEVDVFLKTGKKALEEAIQVAKPGNRIGHISQTIQRIVEGGGYSVVRSLIGHGVGRHLHEEPEIPGYLDQPMSKTPLLKTGMTIAIEVIYNMGKPDVVYAGSDGWTISTRDGSISGVFERTIAITGNGMQILTA